MTKANNGNSLTNTSPEMKEIIIYVIDKYKMFLLHLISITVDNTPNQPI